MDHGRILLVDDEDSLRMTLAANLELEGFEVVEAASGEEALKKLEAHPVDIVLSDIRMPGLNGVDLLRRIKAQRPGIPVVLMTAFSLEGLTRDAATEGVYTVLPKPFDPARAVETLRRALKGPAVLVVDDVRGDAESTAAALRAAGLRGEAAFDGEKALARFQSGEIDVCVVDLVMPGMSGADVVDRLRKLDPTVSIIAVSGHSVPQMMQRVAGAGAFACMSKPFDPRELLILISQARGAERPG